MVSITTVASIAIKVFKVVLNLIILILYRVGYGGQFLGVGGTWNLNEAKNADVEIVSSGVFVGFFIYTVTVLISYCFGTMEHKKTIVELAMNFAGMCMFTVIGGIALHYWHGFMDVNKYLSFSGDRQVGLALGSLCVLQGAAYLVDLILAWAHFAKEEFA